MAGKRCTREEYEKRMLFALTAMRQVQAKYVVVGWMQKQFGIGQRMAAEYVRRACVKLTEEAKEPRLDKRARVGAMLEDMLSDQSIKPYDRLRAMAEYSKLYGLRDHTPIEEEAPTRDIIVEIEGGGEGGGDWRDPYQNRLASGDLMSAGNNGDGEVPGANGNGGVGDG